MGLRPPTNIRNLQNLPAGSTFGKLIKRCFVPSKAWLFCGADFNALEDRINTLLTKDVNKLKVYTDGYDSHSLRAYAYFKNQMPDILQVNTTEGKKTYKLSVGGQVHYLIEGTLVRLKDGSIKKVEEMCLPK